MQRYFPRLFSLLSLPVLLVWAGEALACVVSVSDEIATAADITAQSFGFEWWLLLLRVGEVLIGVLICSLPIGAFNVFSMWLSTAIGKFMLNQTTTPADVCWPAALVNLLLLGGIGIFFIPASGGFFAEFGGDLPAPTLLVTSIHPVLWFLPFVAALIVKCIIFKGIARQPRLNIWLPIQLVSLLLLATLLWALYLPIFGMGAVI